MIKNQTISFNTLGCRLNQSETAVIENTFVDRGYTIVDFQQPADVVVINTCTVTENGDADTRRLVNKINRLNPNAKIALIGCQAQVQKEQLATMNNVKWIIGNAAKMDLVSILEKEQEPENAKVIAPAFSRVSFRHPAAGIDHHHTRANLKIQDGCDFFCSFCEIPYARGRARSRVFEDILLEARALVAASHKEIVLTGINLGTYSDEKYHLLDVIKALMDIEGLLRVRISSIEPTTIPDDLIALMKTNKKLCRHLHIPLQSGSDKTLKVMKRKYTVAQYDEFIQKAFQKIPGICLGTDVIVGFPGESEEDFKFTYEYLRDSAVHYFHVFSYSERQMAKSQSLLGRVDNKIIQERSQKLRELSQRKRELFYRSQLNTIQDIIFEEENEGLWSGFSDNYLKITVKVDQNIKNESLPVVFKELQPAGKLRGDLI